MRIVHVTGGFEPGLGYEENCLPLEQAKNGNQVTIITSVRRSASLRWIRMEPHPITARDAGENPRGGSQVTLIRLASLPQVHGQVAMLGLGGCIRKLKPDVVHAHGALAPYTLQCLLANRGKRFRLFVDDHSHTLNLRLDSKLKRLYVNLARAVYKLLLGRVDEFLPVTKAADAILGTTIAIPMAMRYQVTLGADSSLFFPSPGLRSRWRTRFHFGEGDFVILWSGRIEDQKAIEILLLAFQRCVVDGLTVHLVLAGVGEKTYMDRLDKLARELGVRDRVHFLGFAIRDDLPAFYNGADIGVWPGAPSITVLEALSTGLPTVLPADEPAYDTIRSHNACEVFDRNDVASLRGVIEYLAANSERRKSLSASARACIESQFAWPIVAERIMERYQLRGNSRRAQGSKTGRVLNE